jgi:SOS-response transcriptional repressor LexA
MVRDDAPRIDAAGQPRSPDALGQRLAQLRHARGWSQRRLAAAAGVSHAYVALLERGRLASPGTFKLDAVARALGARSTAALLGESNPPAVWSNVGDAVDQAYPPHVQRLPVYRWGSCGDPRDRESPPDPDHLEYPPLGRESLIGPHGFGVMVKGDSMAGRGIYDGDVVWINPDRAYQVGKVVLALVSDAGGVAGMVVKTFARTEVGDCLMSEPDSGRTPVLCAEFKVIGPVVGITSWRLPS